MPSVSNLGALELPNAGMNNNRVTGPQPTTNYRWTIIHNKALTARHIFMLTISFQYFNDNILLVQCSPLQVESLLYVKVFCGAHNMYRNVFDAISMLYTCMYYVSYICNYLIYSKY